MCQWCVFMVAVDFRTLRDEMKVFTPRSLGGKHQNEAGFANWWNRCHKVAILSWGSTFVPFIKNPVYNYVIWTPENSKLWSNVTETSFFMSEADICSIHLFYPHSSRKMTSLWFNRLMWAAASCSYLSVDDHVRVVVLWVHGAHGPHGKQRPSWFHDLIRLLRPLRSFIRFGCLCRTLQLLLFLLLLLLLGCLSHRHGLPVSRLPPSEVVLFSLSASVFLLYVLRVWRLLQGDTERWIGPYKTHRLAPSFISPSLSSVRSKRMDEKRGIINSPAFLVGLSQDSWWGRF